MRMKNKLLLKTKNDIPFIEARINIHQPTINEISLIGENNFHVAVRFLTMDKEEFSQDKSDLENMSDFDIIMSIVQDKTGIDYKINCLHILTILFPGYTIKFTPQKILLLREEDREINKDNFPIFKDILLDMFCLRDMEEKSKYNPKDGRAAKIAEKLKKGASTRAKKKGKKIDDNLSLYEYYISILAVGENKDWNQLLEYTVPQLTDEFKRFQRKNEFDAYRQAIMAGAQNLEEVRHWMVDNDKIS